MDMSEATNDVERVYMKTFSQRQRKTQSKTLFDLYLALSTMSTTPKIYLIAGATRGIGCGLVASLFRRENSTVIAGVRDIQAETAKSLEKLPKGNGSKLIVVGIDAESYVLHHSFQKTNH